MANKEIVMYSQAAYSPFVALARDLFIRYNIPFREIDVNTNAAIANQLKIWTGQPRPSIPTIIVAAPQSDLP
ncbi:MAG TPA: glutaredoxin domain-containing protein, partial [Anaerolineae bacterium]|nr:glutaredoxin domain-containing protein [Anaerolineae bacterium]